MGATNSASMRWASTLSLEPETAAATTEVVADLKLRLGNRRRTRCFSFLRPTTGSIIKAFCTQSSGNSRRSTCWAAPATVCLATGMRPSRFRRWLCPGPYFRMYRSSRCGSRTRSLPGPDSSPRLWEERLGIKAATDPQFILLADPFTLHAEDLLAGLDFAYPQAVKIGGLASGGRRPGQDALFLDSYVFHDGAVGLALSGAIRIETLVAQGCRPFGPVLAVTKCERNILLELDHRAALEVLHELYHSACARDQALVQTSLHIGLRMDPLSLQPPGPGDFLIRSPVGMDEQRGGLARLRDFARRPAGQFHLPPEQASRNCRYAAPLQRGAPVRCPGRRCHRHRAACWSFPPSGAASGSTAAGLRHARFRTELGDVPLQAALQR